MREAVIVAASRTPVGKALKGTLRNTRPDELGALVVKNLLEKAPALDAGLIEDVILGCAFPEGEQGMNIARSVAMRAGLPTSVPGMTVNRYCASGLQTIAIACEKVMSGFADVVIAGGVESMSMVPMGGYKPAPNPYLMEHLPELYMSMGHTAEEVSKRFNVTREQQDEFSLQSHQKAARAIDEGRFDDQLVPVTVKNNYVDENGKFKSEEITLTTDEGVRRDTNLETLGKLKPAFDIKGTVTAGNSSQTSDGAAAVLVMSREKAEELGVKPLAIFRGFSLGGVDPEIMGVGPVEAVPKVLQRTGLSLQDIDLVELNEAFASQALAVIKELNIDPSIVNVNGGAVALGHPLGCSGAKLTVQMLHELERSQKKIGLITMCIGGGMGAAGIIERVS